MDHKTNKKYFTHVMQQPTVCDISETVIKDIAKGQ